MKRNKGTEKKSVAKKKQDISVVVAGCFHWPFTEMKDFAKWIEFIEVFQPNEIYLLGSILHFDKSLRRVSKKRIHEEVTGLKEEIRQFRRNILEKIRRAVPDSKIVYLEGVTERRLKTWAEKQEIDFETELLTAMKLEKLRIEYIFGNKEKLGEKLVGRFLFKQGSFNYGDSVSSAIKEYGKEGMSGASCLSHFISTHHKTEYCTQNVWYETGCLCQDGVKDPGRGRGKEFPHRGFLFGWFDHSRKHFTFNNLFLEDKLIYKKKGKKLVFWDPRLTSQSREIEVGCIHIPFEHKKSKKAFIGFLKECQPNRLHLLGDIWDLPEFSYFKDGKDERTVLDGYKNMLKVRKFLKEVREILPNAKIFYYEGNHERRLKAYIKDNARAFLSYGKMINVPELLKLKELDIVWVSSAAKHKEEKFWWRHGNCVASDSGKSAFKELSKGLSGGNVHTHRAGLAVKRNRVKLIKEYELGCLCIFDLVYMVGSGNKANWQRGFGISYKEKRGSKETTKVLFMGIFRGRIYFADKFFLPEERPKESK